MARPRVKMNPKGVRAILQSPKILSDLKSRAGRMAAVAGPGMEVDSEIGPNRARASVRTNTAAARRREATDRALTRSIDAGR